MRRDVDMKRNNEKYEYHHEHEERYKTTLSIISSSSNEKNKDVLFELNGKKIVIIALWGKTCCRFWFTHDLLGATVSSC